MNWKKAGMIVGAVTGVFLGMKYVLPVMLPFLIGWILSETVHPMAAYLADRPWSKKLRFTESGIGSAVILLLVLLVVGFLIMGAEAITQKAGECVKYVPVIQRETEKFIYHCCESAEDAIGISAEKSSAYISQQIYLLKHHFWNNGNGVEKAMHSVKTCVSAFGVMMISIISGILFLQEREKVLAFLEKQVFYTKIKDFFERIRRGIKEYLKAQVKIMLVICLVCVIGLWILKIPGFFGWGLTVGLLDALPVLGTGLFFVPAGILFLIRGNKMIGIGFLVLYLLTAAVRQFMEPRLVGLHIGVSPLVVLLSVYLGIICYGGVGFILGPFSALLLYGIFTASGVFTKKKR